MSEWVSGWVSEWVGEGGRASFSSSLWAWYCCCEMICRNFIVTCAAMCIRLSHKEAESHLHREYSDASPGCRT